ncbi:condensin II complex subunit CAP-H2 or CNDH2, c-term domain-containing protein [Ditylenchus destructor]|uniref:Condensin II complex subunit CAP-H2 or CNDH2, c-term domain-containing protein n=1 Tax=Ditylenchus destructor TaxID=166010 RepID=A0AAD4RCT2_9BILA|nr:condensin II complex subunit CAP-H2 or CNDH2, c-term domain-containing protein [Ditylenchus destructor]
MDDLNDLDGLGGEYQFLLQPVRDLATNWEIDISACLAEYIRKLIDDSDTYIEDNGNRKLFNFAEAAVLIHGSTNVYSKKVEYVYQIATNFFDQLKESKPKKRQREDGAENNENDGSDDEGPESTHRNPYLQPAIAKSRLSSMKQVLTKLSKPRQCLPIVPIAFTPLADYEKTDVPLCNRLNPKEVIGKKDDFKLNVTHIHEAVALLDLKNIDLIDRFTFFEDENIRRPLSRQIKQEDHNPGSQNTAHNDDHDNYPDGQMDFDTAPDENIFEMDTDIPEIEEGRNHMESGNLQRPTLSVTTLHPDTLDPAAGQSFIEPRASFGEQQNDNQYDVAAEQVHHPDDNKENHITQRNENRTEREPGRPITPLDAYREINDKRKPFKLNPKCCTVASQQVRMRNSRIEKECKAKGVPNVPSVKAYIDSRMYRKNVNKRWYALAQFNQFLGDHAPLALNPQIYAEEKRRTEMRKRRELEARNAERAARRSRSLAALQNKDRPSVHFPPNVTEFDEDAAYEDAIEELVADEIIDGNEPDEPEEFHPLGDVLTINDLEDSLGVANLYADGCDLLNKSGNRPYFSSIGFTQNNYDDTIFPGAESDGLLSRPLSQMGYDELVAYHLRKYWSTAEEATSKFCERVQKWEEKITPMLEREQQFREFDTRHYGEELFEQFHNKIGAEIDFKQVMENATDYELSRYLLVSLVLTNMRNVELIKPDPSESNSSSKLKLKLLKSERHYESL